MKFKKFMLPLLALFLAAAGVSAAHALQGPPPPGYGSQPGPSPPGWDTPPSSLRTDIERQGFHDGIVGASKDWDNHRRPDVMNRDEYRHPSGSIPPRLRKAYQRAFQQGYNVGVRRYYGRGRY